MNKAHYVRKEDAAPKWRLIDAEGKVLGRLATTVTEILRGKDKPYYTPHTDCGDYVVIINADKIVLSGDKWEKKEYVSHSLWIGGKKVKTAKELFMKHPTDLIELAVKRMLPKNILSRQILKKLNIYTGNAHPHKAQSPELFELETQLPSKIRMPKKSKVMQRSSK